MQSDPETRSPDLTVENLAALQFPHEERKTVAARKRFRALELGESFMEAFTPVLSWAAIVDAFLGVLLGSVILLWIVQFVSAKYAPGFAVDMSLAHRPHTAILLPLGFSTYVLTLAGQDLETHLGRLVSRSSPLKGDIISLCNKGERSFHNPDLRWASFHFASLSRADFRGSHLTLANLRDASRTSVDSLGAYLRHTNLVGAILDSADLTCADPPGAQVPPERLGRAKLLTGAAMPDGPIHS